MAYCFASLTRRRTIPSRCAPPRPALLYRSCGRASIVSWSSACNGASSRHCCRWTFTGDLTGKAPGGRTNRRNCTTAPASQQHGIAQPGYGHAMRIAAGPGAALSFDAEQSSGVVDVFSRNSSGVIVTHRQLWIDTPLSIEEKVRWSRAAGLAGVGFWTADAVASVNAYYWGPGCSGEASQKAGCPENHTQTVANARAMWAAVRRALM